MSLKDVPELFLTEIKEDKVRDNFRKITTFFRALSLFSNFKAFAITFQGTETHHKFTHNLGFLPKDVLITSKIGSGSVTFNQELTTSTELDITVTGPCEIRFLAGAFN